MIDNLITNLTNLTSLITVLTVFLPTLIGFMSTIAAVLPPPDPASKWYNTLTFLRKWINILACNVKHAKNKD